MKKFNKKGFTIVELVIVIAVIAILAAVLIPTFSGVIEKANASSAQQQARAALTAALGMSKNGVLADQTTFIVFEKNEPEYYFQYVNGVQEEVEKASKTTTLKQSIGNIDYQGKWDSIICAASIFYNDSNQVAEVTGDTKAEGTPVAGLITDLYAFGYGAEGAKVTATTKYKFTQNEAKTGYNLYVGENSIANDAKPLVEVFTSVDIQNTLVVFVPTWEEEEYRLVEFEANGTKVGNVASQTLQVTKNITAPTNTAYDWYTDDACEHKFDFANTKVSGLNEADTDDTTGLKVVKLYAKPTAESFTIGANANATVTAQGDATSPYKYGDKVKIEANVGYEIEKVDGAVQESADSSIYIIKDNVTITTKSTATTD